ncbi:hypothetical protein [Beijerinckia sp. L45]|uniref:hypothetical protein n=1 Tax=Beijerinckia sp. L45 TaxID=1641855 RepID=UPI00131B7FB7|nr:hypothetical protein [Beijerinckia sp. L45]
MIKIVLLATLIAAIPLTVVSAAQADMAHDHMMKKHMVMKRHMAKKKMMHHAM